MYRLQWYSCARYKAPGPLVIHFIHCSSNTHQRYALRPKDNSVCKICLQYENHFRKYWQTLKKIQIGQTICAKYGSIKGTRANLFLFRAHDLLFRSHEILSRSHKILFRAHDLLFRAHHLLFRSHEILSRSHEIVFRGNEIISRAHEIKINLHVSLLCFRS